MIPTTRKTQAELHIEDLQKKAHQEQRKPERLDKRIKAAQAAGDRPKE
jgi:hypothetical protein